MQMLMLICDSVILHRAGPSALAVLRVFTNLVDLVIDHSE